MGKQVNLFDTRYDAPVVGVASASTADRKQEFVAREPYEPYDAERLPEARDEMCVVHQHGQVKRVRFLSVSEVSALVSWPISNDIIEVNLKTGDLKIKRGQRLWRLEPSALKACRRLRNQARKKLRLLPGDE